MRRLLPRLRLLLPLAIAILPACTSPCYEDRPWSPWRPKDDVERWNAAGAAHPEIGAMTQSFRDAEEQRDALLYFGGFYKQCR